MAGLPPSIGRDLAESYEPVTRFPKLHAFLTGRGALPLLLGSINWPALVAWIVAPPALWAAVILVAYHLSH